jgi:Fic family protein
LAKYASHDEAKNARLRFMADWIWQSPNWPDIGHDARVPAPALSAARRAQGEILGLSRAMARARRRAISSIWRAASHRLTALDE